MKPARIHWTRRRYQHAHRLARLLHALHNAPIDRPAIVERYHELWERYPQFSDPLLTPVHYRYDRDDIPF